MFVARRKELSKWRVCLKSSAILNAHAISDFLIGRDVIDSLIVCASFSATWVHLQYVNESRLSSQWNVY